jgi:TP901 family phage tail tape measure protein
MREVGQNIIENVGIGKITGSEFFGASVEFDKLGTSLQVFGGLTEEQRKQAEDFANVIGKDYPLSANEALSATLDLIKAGQDLESTQFILPAAADLASLSDSGSIENATGFIIQATSTFKEFTDTVAGGFENADTAVNIIAAAADSSTASVEGLAEGLANVGPVASQFGLSLEETTGILALFTDGGIAGAEAGTQLKSFLTNLTTEAAQKELANLGVKIQDSEGKFRSMNDILNDLQTAMYEVKTVSYTTSRSLSADEQARLDIAQKALASATRQSILLEGDLTGTAFGKNADKKLGEARTIAENASKIISDLTGSEEEAQRITREIERSELANAESLKKIAGAYGQSGLAILLAQGEDGLKNFVLQMREVEPASVRAKKALDNISGDLIQLQGSVETLATKALVPLLEKFFRPFVQFGRFVVDSILAMDESIINFTATALVLGSALATLVGGALIVGGIFVQIGGAIFSALAALSAMSTLVMSGAIVSFFAAMATGALALLAAFAVLAPILGAITLAFDTMVTIFKEDRGGAFTQLANLAENVKRAFAGLGTAIGDFVSFIRVAFGGDATTNIDSFGASLASFFNRVSLAVTKFQTSGAGKTLMDFGRVFRGFATALSMDSALEEATKRAADSVDSARRIPAAAAEARKRVSKEYTQMVLDIAKNNSVLSSLLGKDNLTFENVDAFLNEGVKAVIKLRENVKNVFGSFARAFDVAHLEGQTKGFGAGLKKFFETLGPDLNKSLGKLAGNVLFVLSNLFNIDNNDLANTFNTKGFVAGINKLLAKALKGVGDFLLNNRDGIKGILTFVFEKLTLGGLSLGRTIANMLGLENIADFFDDAINTITSIFGGIVDTIFNLIEGMSLNDALLDAFGPGIQPVLDLMNAFGDAVDNIIGFIGKLFTALTGGGGEVDPNAPNFLTTLFNTVLGGLTGFITFLNDNVLSFLGDGDIAGLITNIATKINSVLLTIDPVAAFKTVSDTIMTALGDAIEAGFTLVGNFLGFDGAKIFADIDSTLKTALDAVDVNGALSTVQGAISDLVTALQNLFGADGTSIIDSIAGTVEKFRAAFEQLFGTFSGDKANTASTKGIELKDVFQGLVNVFAGILTGTINTITDFADGIGKLADMIAGMNPGEILLLGSALTVTLAGIAIHAGVPAIMAALGISSFSLSAGLSALGGTMAAKAGALLVFIQFFRAIAQNLGEFQKVIDAFRDGDIGAALSEAIGAFSKVFVDLGFNLLEMLGITEIFGMSRDEFTRVANMMVALLRNASSRAGDHIKQFIFQPISDFINITIPLLFSELERLATKTLAAVPGNTDAQTQIQRLDAIDATAFGNFNFKNVGLDEKGRTPMEAFLEDVVAAGGDQAARRLGSQAARDNALIFGSALADFNWLGTLDDATRATVQPQVIANMVSLFTTAGLTDEMLQQALASGNTGFFQALVEGMLAQGVTITPEMQAQLAASISAGFDLTNVDDANAKLNQLELAIQTFTDLELDPTQLIAERDRLKAEIDAFIAADDVPPTEVTTDVDVTINPPTVANPEDVVPGVQGAVDGVVPEGGVETPVDVKLRPNWVKLDEADGNQIAPTLAEQLATAVDPNGTGFDMSTLTNPDEVANFQSLVIDLAQDVISLAKELNALPDTQIIVTTSLTEIQTQITLFRDTTVPMFTTVKDTVDLISGAILALNGSLLLVFATSIVGFPTVSIAAAAAALAISGSFFLISSSANQNLAPAISKVNDLATALRDAATAARELNGINVSTTPGGGGGGGDEGPGRAKGGPVNPGIFYPFLEENKPELLSIGNKTWLATPERGVVTPIPDRSAASRTGVFGGVPQTRSAMGGSTNAGTSVTIVEGDINVTVTGANVANESQLVARIAKAVELQQSRRTQKLSDKMRTNHR